MKQLIYTLLSAVFVSLATATLWAGNPDRQGEAGAFELLLNPWARSAGLYAMNTANAKGADALFINPAGVGRIAGTEFTLSHTRLFSGSGISLNALGFAQRIGKGGSLGVSVMAVDFGDILVTTDLQPEGTGATFSPNFINIGLSYAYTFDNKISVGALFRGVSESTPEVSSFGFAIDAGVQYVSGPKDEFKFGISLKNIGSRMRFSGQGLTQQASNPRSDQKYSLTYSQIGAGFELPSMLNIGGSYDINFDKKDRLTVVGNFTSNAFSRDQLGGGLEYSFNDIFAVRGGYKHNLASGGNADLPSPIHTGLSAGVSFDIPLKKATDNKLGLDYAYLTTTPLNGTHAISVRLGF